MSEAFRGVIYASVQGKSACAEASGYRQLPDQLPNQMDTAFPTASAGKAFVAAGILKLIEEGRLRFDTEIGAVKGLLIGDMDKSVTVLQLLTHTSGIPDYFDESVMEDYEDLWRDFPNYRVRKNADLIALFIHNPMKFMPGERFEYNNSGYVMLALIIECVTGMPFDEYLSQTVFAPLGMSRTGYFELDCLPGNCACAYLEKRAGEGLRSNIYCVDAKGTGAGGAFTTAKDIESFWRGLASGKVLSNEMFSRMRKPHTPEGEYGLGVWIAGDGCVQIEGMDPGVCFVSKFDPARDIVTAVVSNYGDDVWDIAENLFDGLRS